MKAYYVKTLTGFRGEARLYRLDPPCQTEVNDDVTLSTSYAVISSIHEPFVGLTMAFPADSSGNILSWGELGCVKDDINFEACLADMGYEVYNED